MLELKGVLNVKQGSGIFFVDSTDKLNQKSLMPYSEIGPFELLQARQVIESNITGFAASQISFNELQELKKIIGLQEKAIAAESDKFEDPITDFIALLPKRRKIGYSSNKPLNYGGQCAQKTPLEET